MGKLTAVQLQNSQLCRKFSFEFVCFAHVLFDDRLVQVYSACVLQQQGLVSQPKYMIFGVERKLAPVIT